ncbi:MAG: lamin tail domain-containing protein, partial [Candidatus Marinimicrobia bacterium]|nr:lamin tail domain-containing protein [Candidatus Neomarinimicrobiota bacterium]
GYRNSVAPPLINLSILGMVMESMVLDETVDVTLQIRNGGEHPVQDFFISIYRDEDQNGERNQGEWSILFPFDSELLAQEEIAIPLSLFSLVPGVHHVEASIFAQGDELPEDDTLRFEVVGSYPRNSISITEVMYSPAAEQQGEWVEIQNRSEGPISLQGWTFSDANQTRHPISDSLLILDSFEYLTLCASSNISNYFGLLPHQIHELRSWPALNSSSDSVRLFDANGQEVTSIFYRGSWGKSATSLERRHPDCYPLAEINWAASTQVDGGTPSRMNTRHLLPVEIDIDEIRVATPSMIGPTQAEILVRFRNLGIDTLYSWELDSDADIHWYGALSSFQVDSLTYSSPILWPGYTQIPILILHDGEILADTSVQVILGYPSGQIALNEIHYNPSEDQIEFLEFVNTASTTIDLRGWKYRDRSGAEGQVMTSCFIQPDSLFLWTTDAHQLADWSPSFAQISELSNWPSLNNSSDSIIILDALGQRMLAHGYTSSSNDEIGKSLERRALWKPQVQNSNWSLCEDPQGITPGRKNSVLMPPHNLAIQELRILDSIRVMEEPFFVRTTMVNAGADQIKDARLLLKLFKNGTLLNDRSEALPSVEADDTLDWDVELFSASSGWISIEAEVQLAEDENPDDNRIDERIYISETSSHLIINEVMPLPLIDQNEWVELYNRSSDTVDLLGWFLADNSGSLVSISDTSLFLDGHSYLVVGNDQLPSPVVKTGVYQGVPHFPTLNNTEERITLFDPQGLLMDEMSYGSSTELVSGRSLERIRPQVAGQNPGNWSICIDISGSTPGAENSIYLDALASQLAIDLNPNPFSPNGDGMADQLLIQYELPFERGLMSMMVFDMAGRKIAEPIQIKPVSHRGQIWWDGETKVGGKAVTGLYIMKLLFDDQSGKVWSAMKKVYVIQ